MRINLTLVFLLLIFSNSISAIELSDDLVAFVGEKISVTEVDSENKRKCTNSDEDCIVISLDAKFEASYKVIEVVNGKYSGSRINFEVFDHYGKPRFAAYKYVLLFVSKYQNRLIHNKYLYFDVYQTKSGKWATCGDPNDYNEDELKPAILMDVEFVRPVYVDVTHYSEDYILDEYKKPIWEIKDSKAYCRQGVFADELFRITNEGVIKRRRES